MDVYHTSRLQHTQIEKAYTNFNWWYQAATSVNKGERKSIDGTIQSVQHSNAWCWSELEWTGPDCLVLNATRLDLQVRTAHTQLSPLF